MADNKNLKFLSSLQFPDTAEYIIDAKYVGGFKADDLISMINSAMIFRGTLSSDSTMSPTITELPTPTKDTIGDVYKVISDGEYDYDNNKYSIAAKNGDIFVAVGRKEEDTDINGNPVINYLDLGWVLVPSGNDFSTIFIGASENEDGSAGLVPGPSKGDQNKFLKADGTWAVPIDTNDNTENTAGSSNSTKKLFIIGAETQNAEGVVTYSNSNVFIENNELYSNNKKIVTEDTLNNYYNKDKVDEIVNDFVTQDDIDTSLESYYNKDKVDEIVNDFVTQEDIDKSLESYYEKTEIDGIVNNLATKNELKEYVKTSSLETQVNTIIKKTVGLYTGDIEPPAIDLNADDVWISSTGVKIYQITTDDNNNEVKVWKDVISSTDPNSLLTSAEITKLKLLLSTIDLESETIAEETT